MSDETNMWPAWEDMSAEDRAIFATHFHNSGTNETTEVTKPPAKDPDYSAEVRRPRDFMAELYALRGMGLQPGESCGWPILDGFYSVRSREWTLLTGIPSHGKSSFLDNVMVNLSSSKSWRWALFSAENLPLERHAATLMALWAGKPISHRAYREAMNDKEFNETFFELEEYFRFVVPPENHCTIDRILKIADWIARHESLNGIVIDPWNELDHSRPNSMTETEYVSRCLTQVRRFAREHDVHVFLVAHPTKLQRVKTVHTADGNEQSVYPVPTPYDVAGSAHFRNKADNCLCVWRDVTNDDGLSQIHIQKIRFREVGRVGVCELAYDKPTGQFIDPAYPRHPRQRIGRKPGEDDE